MIQNARTEMKDQSPNPGFNSVSNDDRSDAIKVLLVDDHKMMCESLRALLSSFKQIDVVGEASNFESAFELVRTMSPDVVVMDVEMPHINGIEATLLLRKEFPDVKVVALSGHAEKYYVQRMLEAGARAYVLKMGAHEDLVSAIRAADLGHTYLSSDIAGWVVERGGDGEGRDEALGAREREVLQLVAGGRTSAQIAKQLHISIKTVETHRRNIARRLRLHGTAELTKYAIREGLSSLESSTQQPRPQA